MGDFRIVLIANSIVLTGIILSLLKYQRVLSHLQCLKRVGITVDWFAIIPLSKKVKNLLGYSELYATQMSMTGLSKEDQMVFHFLWSVFMPAVCLVGLLSNYRHWKVYGMILLSGVLVKRMLIVLFKKRRKLEFNKNAYRLYKFLHNQISAGVQPKESMASLYRIVKEPFLRERLQALGSMYSQTLDFEMSFNEISTYYEGADVNSFKIAIAQGISLGNNLTTLKKQEELMFSKYMNYLQLETNRQKAKTFFVVSIYCMIIILMIGLPLMMELAEALDMIFMR